MTCPGSWNANGPGNGKLREPQAEPSRANRPRRMNWPRGQAGSPADQGIRNNPPKPKGDSGPGVNKPDPPMGKAGFLLPETGPVEEETTALAEGPADLAETGLANWKILSGLLPIIPRWTVLFQAENFGLGPNVCAP